MPLSHRLLAISLLTLFSAAPAAHADVTVELPADAAHAAAPPRRQSPGRKTAPGHPAPARHAPAAKPASGSRKDPAGSGLTRLDRPLPSAIVRRGSVPVLPPVDGSAPAPPGPAAAPEVSVQARLGKILPEAVNAFRLPDPQSPWVARLSKGQQVAIVSQWQGWFAVLMADGSQAYVPGDTVEVLPFQVKSVVPARPATPAPVAPPMPLSSAPAGPSPQVKAVLEEALRYVGTRYVYGGNSEAGIDCSGLVRNCFLTQGLRLPRRASEQAQVGEPVALDQLQPGDRLYFSVRKEYDHTGIYVGNGYFVHASLSRGKVAVDHLSTPLYGSHLAAARRF